MKLLQILIFLFILNNQALCQEKNILSPMNWVGINFAKTINVNNLILDFEVKRKIYKTNKIELNISAHFEIPFELLGNREISFSSYNSKYGLNLESNFILSSKSYFGIGLQFEKHSTHSQKLYINPKVSTGFVINNEKHIILEFFIEYNKVHDTDKDSNPSLTVNQQFEKVDSKITLGFGIKKSIFHNKSKWAEHEKRSGIIQTL